MLPKYYSFPTALTIRRLNAVSNWLLMENQHPVHHGMSWKYSTTVSSLLRLSNGAYPWSAKWDSNSGTEHHYRQPRLAGSQQFIEHSPCTIRCLSSALDTTYYKPLPIKWPNITSFRAINVILLSSSRFVCASRRMENESGYVILKREKLYLINRFIDSISEFESIELSLSPYIEAV